MVNSSNSIIVGLSNQIKELLSAKANTSDLSTVATTGSYNDLTDTPDLDEVYDYIDTVIGDIEEDMLS